VPLDVRETRRLFRLTAFGGDLSHSSRQTAIVAADTEDEARLIDYTHDAFGRDWRDPGFAVCDAVDTQETHIHGDVTFRSVPMQAQKTKPGRKPSRSE
jgi:hypothetical protein